MTADTPGWVRDAVFYEIFPDRFAASERVRKPGPLEPWDAPPTGHGFKGGDLLGIVEHLDYLEELGITALYLTPIFQSASNHRYHAYDYLRVDPMLGGDEALRVLLDAAHGRGMRVILDGVFNHSGRGFWPFHHVLENGASSPYRRWFHFDDDALDAGRPLDAYPAPGTPPGALGYRAWWGLPALPKLNMSEPAVREYVFEVAEHWLRLGIDGWRLDVPEEIEDETFWHAFRARCRTVRQDAYLVGEVWHVASEWVRGDRFDALMGYPLAEAILGFAGGSRLDMEVVRSHPEYALNIERLDGPTFAARLADLLAAYEPEAVAAQLNLLGSHDTPRLRTVLGDDVTGVRLASLIQMTLPGAPCIFYGDEIGIAGGSDPDCRRAFPWDEGAWDHELRDFVRALVRERHGDATLRSDHLEIVAAAGGAMAYQRRLGDARTIVAVNAGDDPGRLELRLDLPDGTALASVGLPGGFGAVGGGLVASGGVADIDLDPRSGAVLRVG